MKKIFPLFLFLIAGSGILKAATSITTSSVSGHWTLAGSPYNIYNSITISSTDTLIIDPGVEIVFQGYYYFTVIGTLKAIGTVNDRIDFQAKDTIGWSNELALGGGWAGMVLYENPTELSFCNIRDIKYVNAAVPHITQAIAGDTTIVFRNCNIFHNQKYGTDTL